LSRGPQECVSLADRHPGLVESLRGLLETAFGDVRLAVLKAGADEFVLKRAIGTDLLPAVDRIFVSAPPEPTAPTGEKP
jgi:hypothetical protein